MDYVEAQLPKVTRIAGCRLLPLSVGHAMVLQRIRSPFVTSRAFADSVPDRVPGTGDLSYLLWICSRPYLEAWRGLHRLSARLGRQLIAYRLRRGTASEVERCHEWLREQFTWPRIDNRRDVPALGAPALAAIKVTLMGELGMSEHQALSYPLALAFWDTAVEAERQGGISIIEETLVAIQDGMEEMRQCGWRPITAGEYREALRAQAANGKEAQP